MSTIEAPRAEDLQPPPSTIEGVDYSPKPCPNCDNLTVRSTTAQSGDPAPAFDGSPVKPGQTIALCDSCGVTVKTGAATGAKVDAELKIDERKRTAARRTKTRPAKPSARKRAPKAPTLTSDKNAGGSAAAIGSVAAGPETGGQDEQGRPLPTMGDGSTADRVGTSSTRKTRSTGRRSSSSKTKTTSTRRRG